MQELMMFISSNWIPLLILIVCAIYEPRWVLVLGIGFMIFGTSNLVFLWIIFVLAVLNLIVSTYKRMDQPKKKENLNDHKWEM